MAAGLHLGVQQLAVHGDLEAPLIRGDQGQAVDAMLEFLEQFLCQANGPAGVVSDRAVNDLNGQHVSLPFWGRKIGPPVSSGP